MMLPKKWGQGQLFAFSALDGLSYTSDDFVGMLSGDRIGVRFFTQVKRELALVNVYGKNLEFDAVTSDYISLHFPQQESMRIIYAKHRLVIGNVAGEVVPVMFTEGLYDLSIRDGAEIHNSKNGEFTAIKRQGARFALAYGHSEEEVLALVNEGLAMDMDAEEQKKLAFFEKHCAHQPEEYADLYAKCLSVMKTQLYSPEANFTTIWSTPDRLPHKHLWLWDSVFHALGHRHISPVLGEDLIRAIWANQSENGFVPHMADVDVKSDITQPPVIAWGSWQVYKVSGNKEFLQQAYENNARFLKWCQENRRKCEMELYTWKTTEDANCRCDECGMDNSPRFDVKEPLYAIDFSCFMANDVRHMALMARELGRADEAAFYEAWFKKIAADVNEWLWSEEDQFYFDYHISAKKLHKVWSVASFLPLFSGVCNERQAAALVKELENPESFGTPFPIPSISQKDETFGSDMWRGPVWINYNYMISLGLKEYGYEPLGREIIEKTIFFMNSWYQENGTIYEFYDSSNKKAPNRQNRKGLPFEPYNIQVRLQPIRDYGWSCTLLFDLLHK